MRMARFTGTAIGRSLLAGFMATTLSACQPESPPEGGGGGPAASPAPSAKGPAGPEAEMLELVNQERRERGLAALRWSAELAAIAEAHSDDMVARNYFAHEAPQGATVADRAKKAKITFWLLGENLGVAPTIPMVHQGLMESPTHRANILKPEFTHVGIGAVEVRHRDFRPDRLTKDVPVPKGGMRGYMVVTQVFSKPR